MSLEHSPSRDAPDRFLRASEVEHMTGLSRTTIWRLEKQMELLVAALENDSLSEGKDVA